MKLEMQGRGIPKEIKAGPVGYNDRKDPLREKAQKMLRNEQVSKPYSPESASSVGNTKLTRGFKEGGHVKTGTRIPTNMYIPREIDGRKPTKTPQARVKKMGGVMQGDRGPGPSKREAEVSVQGQKGPHLKKGGDCYAHGGHVVHKGIGGTLKKVGKAVAPVAKAAYKASKPALRVIAKKGIDYGSKALGAAATGAATVAGGPAAGVAAGYLASKGSKALGKYATKKAGLKAHGGEMEHKSFGGMMKSAGKAGLKIAAKEGVKQLEKKANSMSHGGKVDVKKIMGAVKKKRAGEI